MESAECRRPLSSTFMILPWGVTAAHMRAFALQGPKATERQFSLGQVSKTLKQVIIFIITVGEIVTATGRGPNE